MDNSIERILTEGGKYKLFMTIASQTIGQDMDAGLARVALSCTNTNIAGRNDPATHKKLTESLNIPLQDLQDLGLAQFYMRSQMLQNNRWGIRLHVPSGYVGTRGAVNEERWSTFREEQAANYNATDAEGSGTPMTPQGQGEATKRAEAKPKYEL